MYFLDTSKLSKMKEKGKVILSYHSIFNRIMDYFILSLIVLGILSASLMNLVNTIHQSESLTSAILLFLMALLFALFIVNALINTKKLTRLQGAKRSTNRRMIKELAEEWEWEILIHSHDISILRKPLSSFSLEWGRSLYIIYDKNDILICCLTFGRSDSISLFHGFQNRNYVKQVKEVLSKNKRN